MLFPEQSFLVEWHLNANKNRNTNASSKPEQPHGKFRATIHTTDFCQYQICWIAIRGGHDFEVQRLMWQ